MTNMHLLKKEALNNRRVVAMLSPHSKRKGTLMRAKAGLSMGGRQACARSSFGSDLSPTVHTEYTQYTQNTHRIHTEYTQNTHRIHTEYTQNTHTIHTQYTHNTQTHKHTQAHTSTHKHIKNTTVGCFHIHYFQFYFQQSRNIWSRLSVSYEANENQCHWAYHKERMVECLKNSLFSQCVFNLILFDA